MVHSSALMRPGRCSPRRSPVPNITAYEVGPTFPGTPLHGPTSGLAAVACDTPGNPRIDGPDLPACPPVRWKQSSRSASCRHDPCKVQWPALFLDQPTPTEVHVIKRGPGGPRGDDRQAKVLPPSSTNVP